MSSTWVLICEETLEAVEVIRTGAEGNTPDFSKCNPKALFCFLSFHLGQTFRMANVESELGMDFDWIFASSIQEKKDFEELESSCGGNGKAVLLWEDENCESLLARKQKELDAIKELEFGAYKTKG